MGVISAKLAQSAVYTL